MRDSFNQLDSRLRGTDSLLLNILNQKKLRHRCNGASLVPACRTGRNKNHRTFRVTRKLPMKINFKFAFEHKTRMSFFAPIRLDKFGSKFQQANLFISIAMYLETCA
jgi:hypothetical protein